MFYKVKKRNLWRNYLQRIKRETKKVQYILNSTDNIEVSFERKIEIEKLRLVLLQLNEEEYKLIKALFFENKTLREYAEKIGISHVAIHLRKQQILKKLKKLLKN